jgi:hypothetical protein
VHDSPRTQPRRLWRLLLLTIVVVCFSALGAALTVARPVSSSASSQNQSGSGGHQGDSGGQGNHQGGDHHPGDGHHYGDGGSHCDGDADDDPAVCGGVPPPAPGPTGQSVGAGGSAQVNGSVPKHHHKAPVQRRARKATGPQDVIVVPVPSPPPAKHKHHKSPPATPSPAPVLQTAPAPAPPQSNPQRSTLADRLLSPTQLDLSAHSLGRGGLFTLLLVALLYLPVTIFNKTTEMNHETISRWLARPRAWFALFATRLPFPNHPMVTLAGGVILTTALFAFVEPGFPTEPGSLEYLIGMMAGFALVSATFFCTWWLVIRRLEPGSVGEWRIYPPYVVLAAILVIVARLAHFLPGVVLGTVAEYEPARPLGVRTAGIRVATTYGAVMVLGLIAWVAWIPVTDAAAKEGASSVTLILDSMLAITFVSSLESVAFGLIPLRFLDGSHLFTWHKGLWALMWGGALFWFSMVILNPALNAYENVGGAHAFWLLLLFSSLMVVALTTWAYFRIRGARAATAGTGTSG